MGSIDQQRFSPQILRGWSASQHTQSVWKETSVSTGVWLRYAAAKGMLALHLETITLLVKLIFLSLGRVFNLAKPGSLPPLEHLLSAVVGSVISCWIAVTGRKPPVPKDAENSLSVVLSAAPAALLPDPGTLPNSPGAGSNSGGVSEENGIGLVRSHQSSQDREMMRLEREHRILLQRIEGEQILKRESREETLKLILDRDVLRSLPRDVESFIRQRTSSGAEWKVTRNIPSPRAQIASNSQNLMNQVISFPVNSPDTVTQIGTYFSESFSGFSQKIRSNDLGVLSLVVASSNKAIVTSLEMAALSLTNLSIAGVENKDLSMLVPLYCLQTLLQKNVGGASTWIVLEAAGYIWVAFQEGICASFWSEGQDSYKIQSIYNEQGEPLKILRISEQSLREERKSLILTPSCSDQSLNYRPLTEEPKLVHFEKRLGIFKDINGLAGAIFVEAFRSFLDSSGKK